MSKKKKNDVTICSSAAEYLTFVASTGEQDALDGKIKITDVLVAKNYLSEFELNQLNRMISSYIDFAKNMTKRKIPLTMQD